jgi:hypothetical protein
MAARFYDYSRLRATSNLPKAGRYRMIDHLKRPLEKTHPLSTNNVQEIRGCYRIYSFRNSSTSGSTAMKTERPPRQAAFNCLNHQSLKTELRCEKLSVVEPLGLHPRVVKGDLRRADVICNPCTQRCSPHVIVLAGSHIASTQEKCVVI